MEKFGFVYIWRDNKYNRYYIGCHWGTFDDGYICSSSWMMQAYKRRPQDFKRRILRIINTNRLDLFKEEDNWLNLIKTEELGKKYYNKKNTSHNIGHWSCDPDQSKIIIEKMKEIQKKVQSARALLVTHCPQGHEYNEENTYHDNRGSRRCKKCNAERINQKYQNLTLEEKALQNQQSSENYYKNNEENLRKQKRIR